MDIHRLDKRIEREHEILREFGERKKRGVKPAFLAEFLRDNGVPSLKIRQLMESIWRYARINEGSRWAGQEMKKQEIAKELIEEDQKLDRLFDELSRILKELEANV